MTNIDKINIKLKYTEYYNPIFNWNDRYFYKNNKDLFNYEFLNLFKDKIQFRFFFTYHMDFDLELIAKFFDYYKYNDWQELINNYRLKFTTEFVNKHYKRMKYPLSFKDEAKLLLTDAVKQHFKYLRQHNMFVYNKVDD